MTLKSLISFERCEMQHTWELHVLCQHRFYHVSLNVIIIVWNI